jgi:hypothetical protein
MLRGAFIQQADRGRITVTAAMKLLDVEPAGSANSWKPPQPRTLPNNQK